MQPEDARTVCVLRRMKRRSLSPWAWSSYNPTKARPEELRFDILDDRDRITGQVAYEKLGIAFMKVGESRLRTPWGEGTISYEDGVRIRLNGKELFVMKGSLLRKGFELVSPTGVPLVLHPLRGRKNDIEYQDEKGYIAVREEKGALSSPPPGRPIPLTKEEIKALPKEDRPRSVESLDYVQYRILTRGTLPVSQDDLVAALAMFASFGCLIEEIPS